MIIVEKMMGVTCLINRSHCLIALNDIFYKVQHGLTCNMFQFSECCYLVIQSNYLKKHYFNGFILSENRLYSSIFPNVGPTA